MTPASAEIGNGVTGRSRDMGDSTGEEVALPWKETSPVKQRKEFVEACARDGANMSELCRRFGVSRTTGYKWLHRYLGHSELEDRSRRPKASPRAVAESIESSIVAARKMRPTWGPRKLRASLQRSNPDVELPSVTTFALIFKRNGLIIPKRRRRRATPSTQPLVHATAPNALWCIDFKGDFLVGKTRCYPLTITDAFSRYLIACVALPNTRVSGVFRAMCEAFEACGLPEAIRSDNGSPFSSRAPCGLSELSAWWWRLGIRHERIAPGKPQENGRHERMHRTLKAETAAPPETYFVWTTTTVGRTRLSATRYPPTSTSVHRDDCQSLLPDETSSTPRTSKSSSCAMTVGSIGTSSA